ncbi:M-phase inducer phosphatase 3 isoform X1 [Xenopus laevis]|uniref:M-phase inducer phosphatase n=2 Tax=Xenopus laevis TaxID=8355 RepID=A0A8J0USW1_XENLA|nr:M-phase inducer phosphatase 3 isoform X1 [Xenopus laevis]
MIKERVTPPFQASGGSGVVMAESHIMSSEAPPKSNPGLNIRTNCRMILNLLREKDCSVTFSPEQPLTPVTDLAVGFSNLSTFSGETPKRCLDLSNLGDETAPLPTESPDRMSSGKLESPKTQFVQFDGLFTPDLAWKAKKCPKRNMNSVLPQLLCSTPSFKKASGGQRSLSNKENEGELFKNPNCKPVALLLPQEVVDSQLSPTPENKVDISLDEDCEMNILGSPISADPPCLDGAHDDLKMQNLDGFADFFSVDEEEMENPPGAVGNLSCSMAILLSGPLLNQDVEISNVNNISLNRSRLYRSPSMPEKLDRPMLKRPVRPLDSETPVRVKRRRSTSSPLQPEEENCQPQRRGTSLKKTLSLCDVDISTVLDEDCGYRQLIGDFSKVYALPTVTGRHQDLRYITGETLAALMHGDFNSLVEKFFIIDCRYPYEYDGGHIKSAFNLHRQEEVTDYFLQQPLTPLMVQKRLIIIFHCEFSSERGPKMCRFLREEDRASNDYPSLYYPELYLLKGGYKDFFPEYKELCEPQSYCPMHHQDFREDLLKFRTKCKTSVGDRKRREQVARLMKL